ncbi:MAG: protein phosphatase 2C domain-containing protein [Myxococcota bacterium]
MLHVDAHFVRAPDHVVGQDYAIARGSVAVVCDGCSGSAHTDVGARLLAHACLADPDRVEQPDRWLRAASRAATVVGLPDTALDATCLLATASAETITVHVMGDGVLAARRVDGSLAVIHLVAAHEAPAYPSYRLDPDRACAHRALAGIEPNSRAPEDAPVPQRVSGWLRWTFPRRDFKAVLVATDGAAACTDAAGEACALEAVVDALFRYPTARGEFVTRRLRRFVRRELAQRGWRCNDDLGLAALCWEDA